MTKIELFQRNIAEHIKPLNYSNRKKYNNYMAIINGLNNDGTEDRTYLRELDDDDLYFNAKDVKKGDIIVASCWNRYKNRQKKCYYIVDHLALPGAKREITFFIPPLQIRAKIVTFAAASK